MHNQGTSPHTLTTGKRRDAEPFCSPFPLPLPVRELTGYLLHTSIFNYKLQIANDELRITNYEFVGVNLDLTVF